MNTRLRARLRRGGLMDTNVGNTERGPQMTRIGERPESFRGWFESLAVASPRIIQPLDGGNHVLYAASRPLQRRPRRNDVCFHHRGNRDRGGGRRIIRRLGRFIKKSPLKLSVISASSVVLRLLIRVYSCPFVVASCFHYSYRNDQIIGSLWQPVREE